MGGKPLEARREPVDESPVALEGIKEGKVFETNSQGFWLQGYVPMEWLYWYHKYGYKPASDIRLFLVSLRSVRRLSSWLVKSISRLDRFTV